MTPIFETCVPRDEVLQGGLREQQFAASLSCVLRGTAGEVHADAATKCAASRRASGAAIKEKTERAHR